MPLHISQTSYFTWMIRSVSYVPLMDSALVLVCLLLTMSNLYEKEMESSRRLLAEVETDEDSDINNEGHGLDCIFEDNFSDYKSFAKYDEIGKGRMFFKWKNEQI
ncbi:hypothetical protein CEXT_733421 [Caerostris extrusa]|uniref:Uncharacterized protein n=1 Tax=Caerostris extrusa TaxID=172846 RepID=A0AAV4R088_CAEEX|nr:hypothetical protein CEXT_733421 [Caerostris extrusa]